MSDLPTCSRCHSSTHVRRTGFARGRPRYCCQPCQHTFVEEGGVAPRQQPRQTTLGDVARALGVSPATVSKALRGYADLNPHTRQAIVAMARQLNYQPNLLAQSLKGSPTYTVGVVVPDLERPFFATAVSGIQQVVAAAGYRVMVCQSNESYAAEVSQVQALLASRVDGLLVCHACETEDFAHVSRPAAAGLPLVRFDRVDNAAGSAQVVLDNQGGAYALTRHLLEQGCRRIAILAGPESLLISRQRLEGYAGALQQQLLPVRPEYVVHGDFQAASASAALAAWLALPEPPDALLAINYRNALDLLHALRQRGLRVPGQVAVAGFGSEWLVPFLEPGLTTFDLHPRQVGQQAAELFLEQVRPNAVFQPRTVVIPGELVVRASSRRK